MTNLPIELEMLLWSTLLYFVQIMIPAAEADLRNGIPWALGNRDESPEAPAGWPGRGKRAYQNMTENLLLFACIVLVVQTSGAAGELSAIGAMVFLISRIAHAILYLAGITVLRSLAYFGGLAGMGMMVYQVL